MRSLFAEPECFDLGSGAWLAYVPEFIAASDEGPLFQELRSKLDWEQRAIVLFGREVMQPRRIAWAGTLPYSYSGQTLEPRAFPAVLTSTLEAVNVFLRSAAGLAQVCGFDSEFEPPAPFNHVLLNLYRSGDDSMGLHSDDEPELGAAPTVGTLSLGASRRFVVKPRDPKCPERSTWDRELEPGSLLIMGGTCQSLFRHGVPKQRGVEGARMSLTFRGVGSG